MVSSRLPVTAIACALLASAAWAGDLIQVLIVDGQNNHDWKKTTPVIRQALEDAGRFNVSVATAPAGQDTSAFHPKFSDYGCIVLNYNGAEWPAETKQALVDFVRGGGGLVVVHAADNAFPQWPEYNAMIGLGGWNNRDRAAGPYLRLREGRVALEDSDGPAGHHGTEHEFQVVVRNAEHPITQGLPRAWMHAKDELYDSLRGPAQNVTLLATAYSSPQEGGTGEHEPVLFTIAFGQGRVFHTTLGHSPDAMRCIGFIETLQRGVEWAATGEVAQRPLREDFPMADRVSVRAAEPFAGTAASGAGKASAK